MTVVLERQAGEEREIAPPAPMRDRLSTLGRRTDVRVAVVTVFLAGYAIAMLMLWMGDPGRTWAYDTPQDHVRLILAEQWLDTGTPTFPLQHYDELPADVAPALTPRDASLDVATGTVIPKDFPNALALYTALVAIHPRFVQLVVPLGCVLAMLAVGFLTWRLCRRFWPAVLAGAFVAMSPQLWAVSYNGSSVHGFTIAIAALGISLMVAPPPRVRRIHREDVRMLLAGVAIGVAIGFHTGWAFAYAAAAVPFIVGARPAWRDVGRRCVVFVCGAVTALLPTALFNWWIYGSPSKTGYSRFDELVQATNPTSAIRTFRLDFAALMDNVRNYWLRPEFVVLMIAAIFALDLAFRRLNRRSALIIGGVGAAGLLCHVLLTGARQLYGTDAYRGAASFNRYSLPLVAFASALAAVGVSLLWRGFGGRLRALAVTVAITVPAASLAALLALPSGIPAAVGLVKDRQIVRDQVFEIVPEDGVVITSKYDKLFWPDRSVLVASYLINDPSQSLSDVDGYLNDQVPDPGRIASVARRVRDVGIPVYVYADASWFTLDWLAWLDAYLYFEQGELCRRSTPLAKFWMVSDDCLGAPSGDGLLPDAVDEPDGSDDPAAEEAGTMPEVEPTHPLR